MLWQNAVFILRIIRHLETEISGTDTVLHRTGFVDTGPYDFQKQRKRPNKLFALFVHLFTGNAVVYLLPIILFDIVYPVPIAGRFFFP